MRLATVFTFFTEVNRFARSGPGYYSESRPVRYRDIGASRYIIGQNDPPSVDFRGCGIRRRLKAIEPSWAVDQLIQALELSLTACQAAANLTQRMRPAQLAKQHGRELAPARETPCVSLGLVLLDRLLEIPARKQLQHLRENAAYFALYIG